MIGDAYAQRKSIQISGNNRTVMVTVPIGKSEDVRTDTSFVDVVVGDPDVADVNPLTDHALSILGKKIGTTRVSVYAEGKKLVGIFDVEVSYDITRLTNELRRRFPGSQIQASTVNGRIMLSGEARRCGDARQGGDDRASVRAGDHQFGVGDVAAAGACSKCGFIEISRTPAASSASSGIALATAQHYQHRQSRVAAEQSADDGGDNRPVKRRGRPFGRVAVRLPDWPHGRRAASRPT